MSSFSPKGVRACPHGNSPLTGDCIFLYHILSIDINSISLYTSTVCTERQGEVGVSLECLVFCTDRSVTSLWRMI